MVKIFILQMLTSIYKRLIYDKRLAKLNTSYKGEKTKKDLFF